MIIKRSILTLAIASLFSVTSPARAAIQLVPVASGLSNPVFVGHAGDGTNRLFIVERGGTIRVLQPGSSSPTLFLDIRTKVATLGGEQGLLGLAFHPNYAINRRFFVISLARRRRHGGDRRVRGVDEQSGRRQSDREGPADDSASQPS